MQLKTRQRVLQLALVGAQVALLLFIITTARTAFVGGTFASSLRAFISPKVAEAMPIITDCFGIRNECSTNAQCGAQGACVVDPTCGKTICECTPQTTASTGKVCGDNGCGGVIGTCANGTMCDASGQCVPMPPYCPRTDNPVKSSPASGITMTPSADASGNLSLLIKSAYSNCPVGSVPPTPCSTYNNDQATCTSIGCSYAPAVSGYCTPGANQVDCSAFDQAQCGNVALTQNQCAWLPDGTGGTYYPTAAAVGLAYINRPTGGNTTYSCQTKPSYCRAVSADKCPPPDCQWIAPINASCFGTPAFKTNTAGVTITTNASQVYEKKIYKVPVWNYESCSFWRCTTKTGYDPHWIPDSCTVGQQCGWADKCVVLSCQLDTSAKVTVTPTASPRGWTLSATGAGGTYDPNLLNACWGTNPNGQFIPAPSCCVTDPGGPFNGGWSSWSACNVNTGTQTRTCSNPTPSTCGGAACVGPSTQACAVTGICDNSKINGCLQGSLADTPDNATQYLWNCNGLNGGSPASCGMMKPVDGQCATKSYPNPPYQCDKGTAINTYQGGDGMWHWDCSGSYNGSTAYGCTEMVPIDGSCSTVHYGCQTAVPATSQNETTTKYTWTCPGQYGGGSMYCAENKIPVNGVCGPNPAPGSQKHYICNAGNPTNNFYDPLSYTYSWNCNGANGGTNAICEEIAKPPKVDGLCKTYPPPNDSIQMHYSCFRGASIGGYDAGASWKWNCVGSYGGQDASCAEMKPINGICAATPYSCTTAAPSTNNNETVSNWTWTCPGQYGGIPANCSKAKPATITWSPTSATVDYNGKTSFAFSTTNAVSCDYKDIDMNTGAVTSIPLTPPNATSQSWNNVGPYTSNAHRQVTCTNSAGDAASADFYITVRKNDATCGTITAPPYLLPGQHFTGNGTMNNTGTNTWTNGSPANYILSTSDLTWSSNTMHLTNSPVPGGVQAQGMFTGNFVAPTAESDYGFSWQIRPVVGVVWAAPFGPSSCSIVTPNGNKIRVKKATLSISPTNVGFGTAVLGDSPIMRVVHVQNLGGGTITNLKIGNLVSPFSCIGSNCNNLNLGPGGSADITLGFQPMATGSIGQDAPILDSNNNPTVPVIDGATGAVMNQPKLYLFGAGTDKYAISTDEAGTRVISSINFGDLAWTLTKFMNITVTNKSSEKSGTINPYIDSSGVFSCVSGCNTATLLPGKHVNLQLKFAPNAKQEQLYSGLFHVGDTPDVTAEISGNAVKPEFSTKEK